MVQSINSGHSEVDGETCPQSPPPPPPPIMETCPLLQFSFHTLLFFSSLFGSRSGEEGETTGKDVLDPGQNCSKEILFAESDFSPGELR